MGRTPIREAIKRLALENLVTVFPRRGTFASEINITDLTAISDVRVQLEGHAAYRAAERITPAGEIELDELRLALAASRDSEDAPSLMVLDAGVHRFVHRTAANPYLEETLGRYFNLSLRIWYLVLERLPHLPARVHEHSDLLEAIRRPRAGALARDHGRAHRHLRARDPGGALRRAGCAVDVTPRPSGPRRGDGPAGHGDVGGAMTARRRRSNRWGTGVAISVWSPARSLTRRPPDRATAARSRLPPPGRSLRCA